MDQIIKFINQHKVHFVVNLTAGSGQWEKASIDADVPMVSLCYNAVHREFLIRTVDDWIVKKSCQQGHRLYKTDILADLNRVYASLLAPASSKPDGKALTDADVFDSDDEFRSVVHEPDALA